MFGSQLAGAALFSRSRRLRTLLGRWARAARRRRHELAAAATRRAICAAQGLSRWRQAGSTLTLTLSPSPSVSVSLSLTLTLTLNLTLTGRRAPSRRDRPLSQPRGARRARTPAPRPGARGARLAGGLAEGGAAQGAAARGHAGRDPRGDPQPGDTVGPGAPCVTVSTVPAEEPAERQRGADRGSNSKGSDNLSFALFAHLTLQYKGGGKV